MKKYLKIFILFFLIMVFLVFVSSRAWAAPKFPTFEEVQQMISDALAPIQTAMNDLSSRLGAAETALSPIPGQISGLQTNDATMSWSMQAWKASV